MSVSEKKIPGRSIKIPNSISIFMTLDSRPIHQEIKNPHFHGSFLDFLERAMGLRALRRAPALSGKIPKAVGIFSSILVPFQFMKNKIPS